jgi:hypothetical protein
MNKMRLNLLLKKVGRRHIDICKVIIPKCKYPVGKRLERSTKTYRWVDHRQLYLTVNAKGLKSVKARKMTPEPEYERDSYSS